MKAIIDRIFIGCAATLFVIGIKSSIKEPTKSSVYRPSFYIPIKR